ncbi:hypothetical protein MYVALT_F_00370 [Candidatus Vallotia tarda]|uniref:Uncharacterized protein n=1 Tax=Candidatus Vallotiella hemipterorum TaxID=1177213 RepID=A0A916JUB9_9BURK|nr:hypothetical protein MYVALT_F_00370 [Candidatus Vallotia tarda]
MLLLSLRNTALDWKSRINAQHNNLAFVIFPGQLTTHTAPIFSTGDSSRKPHKSLFMQSFAHFTDNIKKMAHFSLLDMKRSDMFFNIVTTAFTQSRERTHNYNRSL